VTLNLRNTNQCNTTYSNMTHYHMSHQVTREVTHLKFILAKAQTRTSCYEITVSSLLKSGSLT